MFWDKEITVEKCIEVLDGTPEEQTLPGFQFNHYKF